MFIGVLREAGVQLLKARERITEHLTNEALKCILYQVFKKHLKQQLIYTSNLTLVRETVSSVNYFNNINNTFFMIIHNFVSQITISSRMAQ